MKEFNSIIYLNLIKFMAIDFKFADLFLADDKVSFAMLNKAFWKHEILIISACKVLIIVVILAIFKIYYNQSLEGTAVIPVADQREF